MICLAASCGAKVTVDGGDIACIHFTDPERSVPNGPLPDGLECAVDPGLAKRNPKAGTLPVGGEWTTNLVCTSASDDGTCKDAAAAASAFESCLASEEGDGCDHPLGGECVQHVVWSACGPDPSAVGGAATR